MRKDYAFNSRKRHSKHRLNWRKWKIKPVYLILGIIIFFVVLPISVIALITRDLPTPNNILGKAKYSTTLLDRNNQVIYQVFDEKNIIPIDIDELPKYVVTSTLAIEDQDFYKHKGYSIFGIGRAFVKNIFLQGSEGGSTLTQQLIKNTLLTPERTVVRKVKELILAVELERRYTKDEILEMYLNMTPYGGTAWGIESAAQYYFGKKAAELTLLEAAVLAGFPQSPSLYSPYIGESEAYIKRTTQVLRRMREEKYITKEKEKELLALLPKVKFQQNVQSFPAPHFVFYVKKELDEMLSNNALYQKGLVIKTTLDLKLQKKVEKIVQQEINKSKGLKISNGAVVVIDPKTGEILAMVGSVDFNNQKFGKFNATLGLRQPGSALKPFTYAVALENGFTPSTTIMDTPTNFTVGGEGAEAYEPKNYDNQFRGPVQLRMALGSSINVPAVKTLAQIGLKPFLQKAYEAGLETLVPTQENINRFGLSITLGGGEVRLLDLTAAYSTLANGGKTIKPSSIEWVTKYNNKVIYKAKTNKPKQVFEVDTAFLISHILSDNNARLLTFGPNNFLNIQGKTVAAKTGTTDDKRDNWTVGYTNDLVVGVWVGNNDNSPMDPNLASGVSGAAPIWRNVFLEAFKLGYKDGIANVPSSIKALEIDALFGGLPHPEMSKRTEYFFENNLPEAVSPFYKKIKISKSTGKKANEVEISSNNYEEKEYFVVIEQDPLSTDGQNRWQEGINAWTSQQDDSRWKPPQDTSDTDLDNVSLEILEPKNNQRYDTNEIRIFAKAGSHYSINFFQLLVNDTEKMKVTNNILDQNLHLDNGIYRLKFIVINEKDKKAESEIKIGINADPNEQTDTDVNEEEVNSPTENPE